jgi:tellurite resistance protein TehA-like permease
LAKAAGPGLWFLATALLPMVIGITAVRTLRRQRLQGAPKELWVAVFPAGMYALASFTLGTTTGFSWLLPVGRVAIWAAVAVWFIDLGRGVLLRLLPEV